jgi:hypothetical protein
MTLIQKPTGFYIIGDQPVITSLGQTTTFEDSTPAQSFPDAASMWSAYAAQFPAAYAALQADQPAAP